MFASNKIQSWNKPEKFISFNNGIWCYNYNIEENTVKDTFEDGQETEKTFYSYNRVRISGKPTVSNCFEAILKEYKNEYGTTLYDTLVSEGSNDQIEDIKYNIEVDFNIISEKTPLERAKELKIREINAYDVSSNINSFSLNGVSVWLDKDTRVGLMNSLTIEKNAGKTTSIIWFNNISITLNPESALQMLGQLELYALACYNKTAEHKVAVNNLTSVSEIQSYDYTTGYPDKLAFTL